MEGLFRPLGACLVHTRLGERFADACGDQNVADQLALSWWKFMSVSALNAIRNGRLERAVALSRSEIQPERCRREDGTDNVTFSHNIIRNHHKSLLIGGGTKEADRDLGKMQ